MTNNVEFNGERLKIARLYRGKTIKELADETEISKQAISQFENGKSSPGFETLLKIINSLGFPRDYFYQKDEYEITTNTFFRSMASTSKKEQLCQIYKTKTLACLYSFLEQYIDFPNVNIDYNNIVDDESFAEKEAIKLREYWGLGNKPVNNIINLMEKNGIVVSSFNMNDNKIDAFTQVHEINGTQRPFVVLGDDKESAVRRQFSAAHELAHIVLHNNICDISELTRDEYKNMEDQANDFAAAFLLPRDGFLEDVSQYPNKLEFYVELKKKWRVSISAMIIRAFRLSVISHNQYQYMMKQLSRKNWRSKEPLDDLIQIPKPTLLKKAIEVLVANDVLDESSIIESLNEYGLAIEAEEIEILLALDKGRLKKKKSNNNVIINLKNFE